MRLAWQCQPTARCGRSRSRQGDRRPSSIGRAASRETRREVWWTMHPVRVFRVDPRRILRRLRLRGRVGPRRPCPGVGRVSSGRPWKQCPGRSRR